MTNHSRKPKTAAETLLSLWHAHRAMERDALEIAEEAYPVGSTVYWCHGDHMRQGRVLSYGGSDFGGAIRVETPSGAKVWTTAYKVLEAQFGSDALWPTR